MSTVDPDCWPRPGSFLQVASRSEVPVTSASYPPLALCHRTYLLPYDHHSAAVDPSKKDTANSLPASLGTRGRLVAEQQELKQWRVLVQKVFLFQVL